MRKFLTFVLLVCAEVAVAQPIIWDGSQPVLELGRRVFLLEDTAKNLSIEQVGSPQMAARFRRSEQGILNFPLSNAVFWLRFSVKNSAADQPIFELGQALLPTVDLFYQDSSGRWQALRSGHRVNLYEKPIPHNLHLFHLPAGERTYFVRYEAFGQPVPIRLWKPSVYEVKKTKQLLNYGLFEGILFFVVLINLLMFALMRQWIYFQYAVYVSMLAMFTAIFEGFIAYPFPNSNVLLLFVANPAINLFIGTTFCLNFLEVPKYAPRVWRWARFVVALLFVYICIFWFFPYEVSIPLNQVVTLFVVGFECTMGFITGRKGNWLGYIFSLTYLIFFSFCAVEITYLQTGSPPYLFEMSHVSVGILVEVLLLAFLLVKRFQRERTEMRTERETARQELLEKTLENERMVREQNVLLEEKVERRTQQLQKANEELNLSLQNIERERQKSESLLLNILPHATAQELKENGSTKPQVYHAVTVLITDFKDFTQSTVDMPPEQLVSELHHCFTEFDKIVQKYGVEKIKTIGDAYLAAAGLPLAHDNHAHDALAAALEMQTFVAAWRAEQAARGRKAWDVRIGLHTGPVVAGVVGTHKFAFDIWGDTVNTAARMESNGLPGKINISATTHSLVHQRFRCTSRGFVEVKGKGKMEMFWVEGMH